jgi:hypothetical protein
VRQKCGGRERRERVERENRGSGEGELEGGKRGIPYLEVAQVDLDRSYIGAR